MKDSIIDAVWREKNPSDSNAARRQGGSSCELWEPSSRVVSNVLLS